MIFDESYENFEEILDELFDVPEDTMKSFYINFTEKDLEDIPSICDKFKLLLKEENMTVEDSELKILSECLAKSPGLGYCGLTCFRLISNQKIAQTCIARDLEGAFVIFIDTEELNNSKTWKIKGAKRCRCI